MSFVTVANQRIHYSESRETLTRTAPLVLLHGAGGNLFHWPPGLRRLPGHTVYAIDLPGHGKSEPPGRQSVEAYAEFLLEWAKALDLPAFVVGGHSMGGAIAQMFALRYPQRLRGLVLVGSSARLKVHPDIMQGARSQPQAVASLLVEWVHGARATPEQKRQYHRHLLSNDLDVVYGDWLACDQFDIRQQIDGIRTPTLIVAGGQDRMTPLKAAKWMHEQIVGADLMMIEDGGHMLMLEQPELVTTAIAGFLDRIRLG